ncbi:MAG: hypothetical protein A2W93_03080 [Bacteroidetes bacterium GWF2_43_63]|nr:MAG: hypothetical protein A2W94_09080 [Bacteroidetes bacterium GWE2_42_42]OFY53647.1 MAG: hypothetical protein A2W93_03080 [Bacteroidetes bacterium GWF2_43_63]HBG71012.1 hypothetical protein [Bacteroidales bacterium]HCB63590.1 hypothetical protein [Bacteroidales bacterium]HCY24339.1 hypothetical protein [Bacteroidales bacterium]
MANVTIRFSVYSKTEKTDKLLSKMAKTPDEITILGYPILLTNGLHSGKKFQETAYTYVYELKNIFDIEQCNKNWMDEWKKEIEQIKKLHIDFGFILDLNYEVTVFDNDYPALYFQPDFLYVLGMMGVQFSMYFYNDEKQQ